MEWKTLPKGYLSKLRDSKDVSALLNNGTTRVFLTGDGHRHPPFEWAVSCPDLKLHFQQLMGENKLCAHVEQYPDQVDDSSVPHLLQPLVVMKRVFGWELAFYRQLEEVMKLCMELASRLHEGPVAVLSDVVAMDGGILRIRDLSWEVGGPQFLKDAVGTSWNFRQQYEGAAKKPPTGAAPEMLYRTFLLGYYNNAMALRTGVNRYIGQNITRVLRQYSDSTHIITCGDAHITQDPLHMYIELPAGADGVIDASNM